MPTYYSTTVAFSRTSSDGLVARVYNALGKAGAPFAHVHVWGCSPDLSLAQIIAWNQAKLDLGFRLGFTENVANDYRQILLTLPPYEETRVFLLLKDQNVEFNILIRESDIDALGHCALFDLMNRFWVDAKPRWIQTSGEVDRPVPEPDLHNGAAPSAALFAFLDDSYPPPDSRTFEVTRLARGVIVTPRRKRIGLP